MSDNANLCHKSTNPRRIFRIKKKKKKKKKPMGQKLTKLGTPNKCCLVNYCMRI